MGNVIEGNHGRIPSGRTPLPDNADAVWCGRERSAQSVVVGEGDRRHRRQFFFFNDTAPPEIYPLSLHDALPICSTVGAAAPTAVGSSKSPPGRASSTSS